MSSRNPYDDYDAIDPWKDDSQELDESGGFEFVEDEYDSMDSAGEDGLEFNPNQIPQTMVRPPLVDTAQYANPTPQGPQPGVLHRNRKRREQEDQRRVAPRISPGQGYMPVDVQPPRRRRRRRHGCLITILLLVGIVVGAYWVLLRPLDEKLAFSPAEQQTLSGGKLSWYVPLTPYNLLALGSDAREGEEVSRTDTMLLVRVDLVGGKITLVSIPRDTRVELPGYGTSKINAAYAYDGVGGSVAAVSKLLGVPINHAAVIHFEELAGLIDYLGGVSVNVPVGVEDPYTGISLSSGMQLLDGQTAVLWARSRYGYEAGDVQRQEDQRILLTSIMNRMLSLSPNQIPGALDRLSDLIGTDLRCYNLLPLFLRLKISQPTIYSCSVPTTSAYLDGQWYEVADDAEVARLMRVVTSGENPAL